MTYNKKVIVFPSSPLWTFFDFQYANDSNPIEEWYSSDLSEESRYTFHKILKDSRKIASHINWSAFKRFLKGKYKERRIWELAFFSDGRQYRVLGVFGPGEKQATLLVGCYHKGVVYTPTNALETAFKRAGLLLEGRAKRCERKIPIHQ